MTTDPVLRYIAATRLISDSGPTCNPQRGRYAEALDDVTSRLEFIVPPRRPRLFVTSTLNATVETLAVGGRDVIVYDTTLGRAFADLSGFASADSLPEVVIRWGLKHLAAVLASLGEFGRSLVLCILSDMASESSVRESPRWSVTPPADHVAMQEHFVIAHEWVHIGLRQGLLRPEFVRSAMELVRSTVEAADSTLHAETIVDVSKLLEADEAEAIDRGSRYHRIGPEARARIAKRHERQSQDGEYIRRWTSDRSWLIEEIVCDFLATDLTLLRYIDVGADAGDVLDAVLDGFLNHSALETIRVHAQHIAHGFGSARLALIAARLVAWRTAAPDVWGHHVRAATPHETRRRLDGVSERHGRAVGDQVTYTLFADATAALSGFPDPPKARRDVLIDRLLKGPKA